MKKYNEGYVLPLVMVVMVVMSLIAVGILSLPLSNLRAQKAGVVKMQSQYAVQGELEKKLAAINAVPYSAGHDDQTAKSKAEKLVKDALGVEIDTAAWSDSEKAYHYFVTFCVEEGNTKLTCTLLLENFVVKETGKETYVICAPNVIYTSYKIGGGGDG